MPHMLPCSCAVQLCRYERPSPVEVEVGYSSYMCGDSVCLSCHVRVTEEVESWKCRHCRAPLHGLPARNYGVVAIADSVHDALRRISEVSKQGK